MEMLISHPQSASVPIPSFSGHHPNNLLVAESGNRGRIIGSPRKKGDEKENGVRRREVIMEERGRKQNGKEKKICERKYWELSFYD